MSLHYTDANGVPVDADGRVTHVGVKQGDVANRIVSVGSLSRAKLLAEMLSSVREIQSARGFRIYTGTFASCQVSVITTGMGGPMMDFLVRETRHVVRGPMAIVRLGTCGSRGAKPGSVAMCNGSVCVSRRFDAWLGGSGPAYDVSRLIEPHRELSDVVADHLGLTPKLQVIRGLNATCDSFYSSQQRSDPNFDDKNDGLFDDDRLNQVVSVEMESFFLLHLAHCSTIPIAAAAAAIVCADRISGEVIAADTLTSIERSAGRAVLTAIANFRLGTFACTFAQD